MTQFLGGISFYPWILIILVSALTIAALFAPSIYERIKKWQSTRRVKGKADSDELYELIEEAGYSYDPVQDMFYSNLDPWQRKMGYCRLYDEASAPLNMIMDCEPIYFEYEDKRWLIELWKGQYGMTTGGEIGVYNTEGPDIDIPGYFSGTFFHSAGNDELLYMSFILAKNGRALIHRRDKHWWLTGFKLGEFSEPSELTMYATIALKNTSMRNAFVEGLKKAGYKEKELLIDGNIVGLVFDEPRTSQPLTRIPETDWLIQRKNEILCDKYQEITRDYDSFPEKMNAIRELAPEVYDALLEIGKTRKLFKAFDKIKDYLD